MCLLKGLVVLLWAGTCMAGVMDVSPEDIDSSEYGTFKGKKGTSCACGWANKDSKRIIGGTETAVNEYPYIAGLMSQRFKIVVCGGSIITPYHVLTAAHCTEPMKEANKKMAVVIGEHNLIRRTESEHTKIINVKESIEHEQYWKLGHPNDIALLVLEEKIEFNQFVGPACLPTMKMDLSEKFVTVIGWGRTAAEGRGSDALLKVHLRVIPTEECNKKLPIKLPVDNPRTICAFRKNKDSCKGDSGGPLLWHDPETNRYTQVGIVSFGISCASTSPGVYTNVAHYLDWIHEKIRATNSDGKTCSKI